MSNVRVYTRDGSPSGYTPCQGTEVFVGDTRLEQVTALDLVADVNGVWTLTISVPVDPQKLFSPLPKRDEIEVTNLMSSSREYVAGKN